MSYPLCDMGWYDASKYKGESYTVVARNETLHWVSRFQIEVRQDNQRTWQPLGIFKGNTDCTTEVAHSMLQYATKAHPEGILARHLRIRPLEGNGMRIQLYGYIPTHTNGSKRGLRTKAEPEQFADKFGLAIDEGDVASQPIEYEVLTPNPNSNRHRTRYKRGSRQSWKDRCTAKDRRDRQRQAKDWG